MRVSSVGQAGTQSGFLRSELATDQWRVVIAVSIRGENRSYWTNTTYFARIETASFTYNFGAK